MCAISDWRKLPIYSYFLTRRITSHWQLIIFTESSCIFQNMPFHGKASLTPACHLTLCPFDCFIDSERMDVASANVFLLASMCTFVTSCICSDCSDHRSAPSWFPSLAICSAHRSPTGPWRAGCGLGLSTVISSAWNPLVRVGQNIDLISTLLHHMLDVQCSPTTQPFSFKAQFNWLVMFHVWCDC